MSFTKRILAAVAMFAVCIGAKPGTGNMLSELQQTKASNATPVLSGETRTTDQNLPQAGKRYYIAAQTWDGTQWVEKYLNNKSGGTENLGTVLAEATVWLCEGTEGAWTFKSLATNKYLCHGGARDAATCNIAYPTKGDNNPPEGSLVVKSTTGSETRYMLIRQDGSNIQSGDKCGGEADFLPKSTIYTPYIKIYETTGLPEPGKTYYISALIDKSNNSNYSHYYIRNESGTTFAWPEINVMDEANQWLCEDSGTEGKVFFKNVKTGKYLGHKTLQGTGLAFSVTDQSNKYNGYASLQSNASKSSYLVVSEKGAWDQATGLFDPHTKDYSTYYRFEDIEAAAASKATLSVKVNLPTGAVIKNGDEELTANFIVFDRGNADIALSVKDGSYDTNIYTFEGFYDNNGTLLGTTYTVPAETVIDLAVTARFSHNIISTNYGDKWLRLYNAENNAHYATLYSAGDEKRAKTQTLDFTLQEQLWCFVGDADGFKVYNMATGETMALTLDAATAAQSGTFQMQAANEDNAARQLWKISVVNGYFAIESSTLAGQGWNPHGGMGNQLKFWTTSAAGTQWIIRSAPATPKALQVTFGERSLASDNNTKMGALTITSDGKTGTTTYTLDDFAERTTFESNLYVNSGTIAYDSQDYDGYTATLNGNALDATAVELGEENSLEFRVDTESRAVYVYYNNDNPGRVPFRIPALATFPDGTLLAVTDMRTCGNDIGFGRVDLWCKTSTDNGRNWGENQIIVEGNGTTAANATEANPLWKCGFGDAALCVDGNDILLMCVGGRAVYSSGSATNRNAMVRIRGTYDPDTKTVSWGEPEDQSQQFFDLLPSNAYTMFVGSGRLFQSRVTRADGAEHNRIYAALLCLNNGNIVVYSDDFGATWNILGSASDRPAPGGNEPKCEELPDGSVILSSRNPYKRIFNVFTYSDESKTTGTWDSPMAGLVQNDGPNGTNGDIFYTTVSHPDNPAIKHHYMLQSVPAGPGRANVKVYRKRIDPGTTYTSATFATGWEEAVQVSTKASGYSAITQLNDGSFGIFYEEVPGGYCMVYKNFSNEEMLGEQNWAEDVAVLTPLNNLYNEVSAIVHPTNPGCIYSEDLGAALANAKVLVESLSNDEAAINAAIEAINTAKDAITEPNSLVVGKWYQFVSNQKNGSKWLLKAGDTTMETESYTGANADEASYYLCARQVGANYVFVNGKYGNYMASRTTNNESTGINELYNPSFCDFHVNSSYGHTDMPQNCFSLFAARRNNTTKTQGTTIVLNNNGTFNGWSTDDLKYEDGYTTLFEIHEVTDWNTGWNSVTFSQPAQADDSSYATFYANYHVELPEGITAYVCDEATNGSLHINAIEGNIVPRLTPVVLKGTAEQGTATLAAALVESAPEIGENVLCGTLAPKTASDILSESDNTEKTVFGLSGAYGKAGFYQIAESAIVEPGHAYYIANLGDASTTSDPTVCGFVLDDGTETGISSASKCSNPAPAYTLQGARAQDGYKGIVIINGKKTVIK